MIQQSMCLPRTPVLLLVHRLTTLLVTFAAITAVPTTGLTKATAASENPPIIQLEPGLDARCVAQVSIDSARLVRVVPQWWSRQFKWEGVHFACDRRAADGSIPFTWDVPGLGIAGGGAILNADARAAQWKWHLAAEKQWLVEGEPGARQPHGGLTFFLNLKSAARRGCAADPILKADRTGFTWEVTPGKTVTVRFSTPLAALYFERGNKSEIRCMFYDAPISVGKLDQTMTIALPEGGVVVPPLEERYTADSKDWFTGALDPHAAFQDWSAIMLYGYSQDGLRGTGYSMWSVYNHPQSMALAPAAALLYREGHVSPAAKTIFVPLSREQAFFEDVSERTSRTLRTVPERHRLMLGLPEVKELPWLKPTAAPPEAETVTDLDRDFIPPGDEVISDTGQLQRNWIKGSFIVDTPKTQIVMGWIKNQPLRTSDASFSIAVPKVAVALSSLDRQPLRQSKKILISTIARMTIGADKQARTEPVAGTIALSSTVQGLRLVPLGSDGIREITIPLKAHDGTYTIVLPTDKQTHWFLLEE